MVNTDITALVSRIEEACGRELGLSNSVIQTIADRAVWPEVEKLREDNARLKARVEELEGLRAKWEKVQGEIAELVGAPSNEKILHALRNVLNELTLLRAIAR